MAFHSPKYWKCSIHKDIFKHYGKPLFCDRYLDKIADKGI